LVAADDGKRFYWLSVDTPERKSKPALAIGLCWR
jgi:hypothetical protein